MNQMLNFTFIYMHSRLLLTHINQAQIYKHAQKCHINVAVISFIQQNLSCIIKHFKSEHEQAKTPFPYPTLPNRLRFGHRRIPPGPPLPTGWQCHCKSWSYSWSLGLSN